jgi:hypothetical protein
MTAPQCPHEHEVITAILAGRRPSHCASLQAHAAECEICRDLVAVVTLLQADRHELHEQVRVPSAGQVWWRAAIRSRVEASQQVARPLSWLFGISVACVAGLAVTVVELLWSPVQRVLTWASPWTMTFGFGENGPRALTELIPFTTIALVLLGAAACLLLAPLALYFVLSDE